jgi:uncharacterized protein with GYD domain
MPRYLYQIALTKEGMQGLLREGGSSRRATVQKLVEASGGKLEAYYFAFGETDTYTIAELPDNETAAAISLTISASGAASVQVTVLLTPEEVDAAAHKTVTYRPPGA